MFLKSRNNKSGIIRHTKWNLNNKTVLPISLRSKYIENEDEIGHLEIDSILGKRNEQDSIIDKCTKKLWLIKSNYKNEHYTDKLIYEYIIKNEIKVKSITIDNGLEFSALVRRFIPKGESMKFKPQIYLDDICFEINSKPREIFEFKCAFKF